MYTASLELCEELYKVSGWDDTFYYWDKDEQYAEDKQWRVQTGKMFPDDVPAYDLGYLVRQLPDHSLIKVKDDKTFNQAGSYLTTYPGTHAMGDTPEDALAQLAIYMFELGVFSKEAA